MSTTPPTPAPTSVRELAEFLWEQSPGHFDGALSKILVSAATTPGAQFLDFRISTYAPQAYVHTHVHPNKEQIYFFLEGEGVLELGAEKRWCGRINLHSSHHICRMVCTTRAMVSWCSSSSPP